MAHHARVTRPYLPPLVALAGAYFAALGCGFTLDDFHFILENPAVAAGDAGLMLRALQTEGGWFYRPLGVLSYRVDRVLFGLHPAAMHLHSLIWHGVATALVVSVGRRLVGGTAAVWAGVLFAVHPVHVEPVVGLANRPELMATCAWLLALRVRLGADARWTGPAVGLLTLAALLCKESGVTLPIAVLLVDRLRPGAGRWRWDGVGFGLLGLAVYLGLREVAFSEVGFTVYASWFDGQPAGARLWTALDLVARYGELLVAPLDLSAHWAPPLVPVRGAPGLGPILGALIGVTVVGGGVALVRRGAPAGAAVALFALTVGPYLHLLPLGVLMAERFLYLPSAPAAWAAGAGLAALATARPGPTVPVVAGCFAAALGLRAADRVLDWQSPVTLWAHEVARPDSTPFAWANYGLARFWAGEPEAGIEALRTAVSRSGRPAYRAQLSRMLAETGRHGEARAVIEAGRAADGALPPALESALRSLEGGL